MWEQQAAKEGFSDCVRKAKGHLELEVERDIEDHKAIFCPWMGSKRISKENACLLLTGQIEWQCTQIRTSQAAQPSFPELSLGSPRGLKR